MGLFSSIMDKLRGHGRPQSNDMSSQPGSNSTASAPSGSPTGGTAAAPAASPAALSDVDVGTVLANLAKQKGGGGNYQTSIVDLLKLLDLDSSLAARTELAEELNVRAGSHGSAEQNIALHKAVMRKVAENGGKVPDSMKS